MGAASFAATGAGYCCTERAAEDRRAAGRGRRQEAVPLRSAEDNAKFEELQRKLREKIYSLIEDEWKERKRMAFDSLYSCLGEYHNGILVLSDDQCNHSVA